MADLEQLFKKQLNNPNDIMGQQYSYLRDMNRIPTMGWGLDMPLGHEGNYNAWENRIKVNPLATNPERTLSHELQHAVDSILDGQRYTTQEKGSSMTPDERRFLEGHSKINEETKIPMKGLSNYRSSRGERQSYGVANSRYPGPDINDATPHLDATMATEQAILLDLANRALKSDKDVLKQFGTWASKHFQK